MRWTGTAVRPTLSFMPRTAASSASAPPSQTVALFGVVRLTEAVQGIDRTWPEGSLGTVVEIYADGEAYEVEFAHPSSDIATVYARQLIPA